jgi:glycosyltransferase involved in cell wall biosynthesis
VLHAHSGNLYGGIETVLVTLARQSMAHSFALCFEARLSKALRETAKGNALRIVGEVRLSRPLSLLGARRRFASVLNELGPDAVLCHSAWSHTVFATVAREQGIPLAFWLHAPPDRWHWLELLARRRQPDLVICNSRFTEAAAGSLFPGVLSEVVHPPVEGGTAERRNGGTAEAGREAVRSALRVPDEAVVIVMVGRMEEAKGHGILLQALAGLKDVPNWVCWLVGDAARPEEEAYVARLRADVQAAGIGDRVQFLGERSDVPDLLAASDVFCHPNTRPEGFGVVFVEALYAGLPVIASATGGALEIVDDTCGILIEPGDVAATREALAALVANPDLQARLGAAGAGRAAELCDPERQNERLLEILDRVVEGR